MKTILFLDIDGVLSIPNVQDIDERKEHWPGYGVIFPVPIAYPLLQAIDADTRIKSAWMSCWDTGAWEWNRKAGTRLWNVAYHLSNQQLGWVFRRFPQYRGRSIDAKLLAVRWFLRYYPNNPVVWIEDGFSKETKEWAVSEKRVRLIDTWPMDENEVAQYLTRPHEDMQQAAKEFIDGVLLEGKPS